MGAKTICPTAEVRRTTVGQMALLQRGSAIHPAAVVPVPLYLCPEVGKQIRWARVSVGVSWYQYRYSSIKRLLPPEIIRQQGYCHIGKGHDLKLRDREIGKCSTALAMD